MRAASNPSWFCAAVLLPSLRLHKVPFRHRQDESGAVLPGVTVEASSPALIEKVRTAVADGAGQYRITGLNPGTYSLTFTLSGFNIVKRQGIELSGTATLTIPVEMRVGALEETITVTGDTPVVDVQTTSARLAQRRRVRAIPGSLRRHPVNAVTALNVTMCARRLAAMTFSRRAAPDHEGACRTTDAVSAPFIGGAYRRKSLISVNRSTMSLWPRRRLGDSRNRGPG